MLLRTLLVIEFFLVPTLAEPHESIGSVSNGIILVRQATVDYYLSVPPTLKSLLFNLSETAWYRDYFSTALKIRSGNASTPVTTKIASFFLSSVPKFIAAHLRSARPERCLVRPSA